MLSEDKAKSCWDSPETIKAMNWWYDNLVKESMPSQQVMGENTADVLFSSGKSAMVMQGSWMVAAFRDNEYTAANCDVAVVPKAEDGTRISIYNGLGWAAAAGGSHTEEAWKLLEYLGSEEAQKKQAEEFVELLGQAHEEIRSALEPLIPGQPVHRISICRRFWIWRTTW